MTNLEDAYLRANIHLADTLAEALISVNEQENKPTYEVDSGGRAKKTMEDLFRKRSPATKAAANLRARLATARAMKPFGGPEGGPSGPLGGQKRREIGPKPLGH